MLFYDLDITAWVRKPGSSSPPAILPVLTIGSKLTLSVQFVRGLAVETLAALPMAGVKTKGDFSGAYLASDNAPNDNGDGSYSFVLDLTTIAAKAPFVSSPTSETVDCVFQVSAQIDGNALHTPTLSVTLQNDYLTA